MKKLKATLLMALLCGTLAGNTFASGYLIGTAPSIITGVVEYTMSLFSDDSCPLRQCSNCRPVTEGEGDNCRPRD